MQGEPLTVGDLASGYGVSATPVREALSRLAGHGLVEDRRGRGYYAHRIDGIDLADLYRGQEVLAQIALRSGVGSMREPAAVRTDYLTDPVQAWETLFEAVLRSANSDFLMSAQQRLADRLAPARRIEPEILGETAREFEPLIAAQAVAGWAGLEHALAPFFCRRRTAVEALVGRMRLNALKYKVSI